MYHTVYLALGACLHVKLSDTLTLPDCAFNLTTTTFYFILSAVVIARLSVLRYFLVDFRRLWMTGL